MIINIMLFQIKSFLFVVISFFLFQSHQGKLLSQSLKPDPAFDKITFDLSAISPQGLIGSSDGLRSVSYEFCIPANARSLKEVQAIDKSINYYAKSPGRIGCQSNQYLCIGNTHNGRWKEILLSIARLEYVARIDQFYGE